MKKPRTEAEELILDLMRNLWKDLKPMSHKELLEYTVSLQERAQKVVNLMVK